jgi:hypothetical protein
LDSSERDSYNPISRSLYMLRDIDFSIAVTSVKAVQSSCQYLWPKTKKPPVNIREEYIRR